MKRPIGRELAVLLLVAAGCSDGASNSNGGQGGAAAGHAGTTDGGAGGTGGADAGTGTGGATGTGGDARGTGGAADGGGDGGGGAGWLAPPPMPPALVAPAGATVKVHVHAEGAQIYTCTASGDAGADAGGSSYAWLLKAPDAKLYDANGVQVGTHGAGPSWTYGDGSVATGVKVIELPSPSPSSDAIPWLLLRVSSTAGSGVFSDISYVQRLSTAGGKAPATGCDATTVGMESRVAYTAEYYLYSGGAGAAWLAPPANLPDVIAVPGSVRIKLHYRGIGFQIYGCLASSGADAGADAGPPVYAWVFKAPDATLYDMSFVPAGSHGMGPSWTSSDLSMITARALAQVDSPLPDAIPWLLLKEFSTSGAGEFSDVSIIQRLNTAGGKAPATGCDATSVDTVARVPYSADYYFFADFASDAAATD